MELSTGIHLTRRIRNVGRFAQITNVFARHGFWSVAERMGVKSWLTPEQVKKAEALSVQTEKQNESADHISLPKRLRLALEELGPAFIKFGQVLATRQDLLPAEYLVELKQLHSNVAPLPFADVKAVLEAELKDNLDLFDEIQEKPLAAGSIGQVHEGRLKTGERVAIKIQRPGIKSQIEIDVSLMVELALLVEKFIPEMQFAKPSAMVHEFGRAIESELDFIREGGNITKISRNFKDRNEIVIPEVYWKVSTSRVLTQSYLEGFASDDRDRMVAEGINPSELVENGLGMFLKMVFVDGLYHGDLHPGNLLALPGNRVGVLDFGLSVHVNRTTRENLAQLLVALIEEDFERTVQHYVEIADPPVDFDTAAFERDVGNAVAPFIGLSLEDIKSGAMFWDLAKVAARHGCPMPQELIIFVKTLASFEGIGTYLDPDFNVLSAAEKFSGEITKELYNPDHLKQNAMMIGRDISQLAKHAPYQVRRLLKAALEGELSVNVNSEAHNKLSVAIDRSSARIAVAVIIAALIIGSSILVYAHIGRQLFSMSVVGLVGFSIAGFLALYVIWSILRGNKL